MQCYSHIPFTWGDIFYLYFFLAVRGNDPKLSRASRTQTSVNTPPSHCTHPSRCTHQFDRNYTVYVCLCQFNLYYAIQTPAYIQIFLTNDCCIGLHTKVYDQNRSETILLRIDLASLSLCGLDIPFKTFVTRSMITINNNRLQLG